MMTLFGVKNAAKDVGSSSNIQIPSKMMTSLFLTVRDAYIFPEDIQTSFIVGP